MATVLIDSCIITDLANPDSDWFEWSASALENLDQNNCLEINPIIYAECSVGYSRIEEVEALFLHLGFTLQTIPKEALFLAAKHFCSIENVKAKKAMSCRISLLALMPLLQGIG